MTSEDWTIGITSITAFVFACAWLETYITMREQEIEIKGLKKFRDEVIKGAK